MRKMKITLSDEIEEILDTVQKENPNVTSTSAAIRFLLFQEYKDYDHSKTKVAAISKEVSISLELIASVADALRTTVIEREESLTYPVAKDNVERRIKRLASTRKFKRLS